MGGGQSQSAAGLLCTQSPLRTPGTFSCSFLPVASHPSPSPASCWNLRRTVPSLTYTRIQAAGIFARLLGARHSRGLGGGHEQEQRSSPCGADILTEK